MAAALLVAISAGPLLSITPFVEGEVTDKSGKPLAGVRVRSNTTAAPVYSDNAGRFRINVPSSESRLYLFKKDFLHGFAHNVDTTETTKISLKKTEGDNSIRFDKFGDSRDYHIASVSIDDIEIPSDEWNSINGEFLRDVSVKFYSNGEAHFFITY